ncbi:sodium-dependent transporter [bacterium]|nr:sodium-dependent transporter [bacterium]
MAAPAATTGEHWSSRFGFLMAAIGSSVGLGNFWRFPYTAGENGGAIFVIAYLFCVALVAMPVLVSEYALGRRGGRSAPTAVKAVATETGASPSWGAAAWVGLLAGFLILSFYSVVAGWVMIYIVKAFSGAFSAMSPEDVRSAFEAMTASGQVSGLDPALASPAEMRATMIAADFTSTISNAPLVIGAHTLFFGLTAFIVGRGVQGGIEQVVKILMPLFFLFLIGIVVFNMFAGNFPAALGYLFQPEPCVLFEPTINPEGVQNACGADPGVATSFSFGNFGEIMSAALGQAFFSVGVGAGLMITYGAYLERSTNITSSSAIIAGSDTLVALIAGLAIFPIVFQFGIDPNGGPGLFFVTLPIAFSQLPSALGIIVGGFFFLLAFFAAITSSISLLEGIVARTLERFPGRRFVIALGVGGVCWLVGLGSALSGNFLDFVDALTEKLLLPLGGLLVAVFTGWIVRRNILRDELDAASDRVFLGWRFLIRWVAPIGASVIFAAGAWQLIRNPPVMISTALG